MRELPAGARSLASMDSTERISISIIVRPMHPLPDVSGGVAQPMSRDAFAARYGASHDDIEAIEGFAREFDLAVESVDAARRTVRLAGSIEALAAAFGTSLALYEDGKGGVFRGRSGTLTVPATIAPIVRGVFGLDNRAQARTQFVRAIRPAAAQPAGVSPIAVADAYGFPSGDGAGETIALIELGGGFAQSDLDTYFAQLGIAGPTVTAVSVDGGENAPTGDPNGPDGEVLLDIEVAGAIAPGAKIVAYFGGNTDDGFLGAITTAIHDTTNAPSVISISWGGPESTFTAQAAQNFDDAFASAAMLGITVTTAAGDGGSSDGLTDGLAHADFPSSSPHVLACGGTRLTITDGGDAAEVVWNDGTSGGATGGGISDLFSLPSWQASANVPPSANPGGRIGRGVPDVAGNADPDTGYAIVVDGSSGVVGGTSAVAPLWAALIARINANSGKKAGFINPTLYGNPSALRDITSGSNGAYNAGPGWDACTGLGSPDGAALATLLAGET
jgi:kumamolisin